MGFFGRARQSVSEDVVRTAALVVEAVAPPEGGPAVGPGSHGPVRILVDAGSGGRVLEGKIRMIEAHWLVPGMEIQVTLDRGRPDRFEIDWDAVPSIEARAAANDATLADPIGARRKVAHALGLTQADTGTSRTERFREALQQAAKQPGSPGKLRAVVLIATIRGRRLIRGGGDNVATHDYLTFERSSAAVLAVNVPGRAPYAVYTPRFRCEAELLDPFWTPLPAFVSALDPNDVEVLWEEVPGHDAQMMDRVSGALARQQAQRSQIDAIGQRIGDALASPDASASIPEDMARQMHQLAADNAKRALHYVNDPAMRKLLIDQYRAAGIDVSDET